MSERYSRPDEPHAWNIDLKWSAWSTDPSVWKDLAPKTYKMLREGFDGYFEESGESVSVISAPKKETRQLLVFVKAADTPGHIYVNVLAQDSWDEPDSLLQTLGLPDNCLDLLEDYLSQSAMFNADSVPGVYVENTFEISEEDFDGFMQQVDEVENELIEESQEAWRDLENWALKQRMEGCARDENPIDYEDRGGRRLSVREHRKHTDRMLRQPGMTARERELAKALHLLVAEGNVAAVLGADGEVRYFELRGVSTGNPLKYERGNGLILELRDASSGHVILSTRIPVEVVGPMVVHPSIRTPEEIRSAAHGQPTSFAVSHFPTGLLVATVPDFVTATWLAQQLVENSPEISAAFAADPDMVVFAGLPAHADDYLSYVMIEAQEPGVDPEKDLLGYETWLEANRDELMLAANPMQPKGKAALYAALGSLVGTLGGLAVGFIGGGLVGGAIGAAVGAGEGAAGGAMVGGVLGMPVGATVGTIYGSVRGTRAVYPGEAGRQARIAAGVGGFVWPVVGPAIGAAIFAPDDQYAANPVTRDVGDRSLGRYAVSRSGEKWYVYDYITGQPILRFDYEHEANHWQDALQYGRVGVSELPAYVPHAVMANPARQPNAYLGDAVARAKYKKAREEWERGGRRGPPPRRPPGKKSAARGNPPHDQWIDYATARARVDAGDRDAARMWLEKVGSWPSSDPEVARLTRDAEKLLGYAANPRKGRGGGRRKVSKGPKKKPARKKPAKKKSARKKS